MSSPRLLAAVLAVLLSVALLTNSPAHAVAPVGDPLATTVTGACSGGPGRVSISVRPPTGGTYRVEVTAQGLAEGSRWTVDLAKRGETNQRHQDFRRVAVDGGWTVLTSFPGTRDSQGDVYFSVVARERGDRSHKCLLFNQPASPTAGLAECNNPRLDIVVVARQRDDGSTVVRSFIGPARPGSRWHLTLTATGASGRQVVDFDDRVGRRDDEVNSRVVITGVEDPRLRLVASNKDQGRCFIGLNPSSATAGAPLTQGGSGKLTAFRA